MSIPISFSHARIGRPLCPAGIRRGTLAFTLVELLVVIAIIVVLIAMLVPALSGARESARTVKCASNLHSIGHGMAAYATENDGVLPASNFWKKLQILPNTQVPSTPIYGTVHWSSYLYDRRDQLPGSDIFRSLHGWAAFQCPSLPDGGLPPANTFPGNRSLPHETSNIDPDTGQPVIDAQAPRSLTPSTKPSAHADSSSSAQSSSAARFNAPITSFASPLSRIPDLLFWPPNSGVFSPSWKSIP